MKAAILERARAVQIIHLLSQYEKLKSTDVVRRLGGNPNATLTTISKLIKAGLIKKRSWSKITFYRVFYKLTEKRTESS